MSTDQHLAASLRATTTHVGTMVPLPVLRTVEEALIQAIQRMEMVEHYKAGGVMGLVSCGQAIELAQKALADIRSNLSN